MRQHLLKLAVSSALCAFAAAAPAQSYPTKPVRIVVGYAAGGGNDIIVRVLVPRLSEALGQPVVVENRPGAQSIIAAEMVKNATPDGYTLFMGPTGPMTVNPAIYSKLPYSPLEDFAPITMIGSFPLILVVSPSLPVKSVKDLAAWARSQPGKSNYGASAATFQLSTELFKQKSGAPFTHIPYKSVTESVNAVIAGQVTMTIGDPAVIVTQLKAGRVRGLAVTSPARHRLLPELPTMAEAGVEGMEAIIWTGFHAPARAPAVAIRRFRGDVVRVLGYPEIRERFAAMAIDPSGNTPEEYRKIIAADIRKWTAVAKAANIKAD